MLGEGASVAEHDSEVLAVGAKVVEGYEVKLEAEVEVASEFGSAVNLVWPDFHLQQQLVASPPALLKTLPQMAIDTLYRVPPFDLQHWDRQ